MSRLSGLEQQFNTIRKRKKSRYRLYESEVLSVKLEQVEETPEKPKRQPKPKPEK